MCLQKVHINPVCDSSKLESAEIPIYSEMDVQYIVSTYNGILFINEKEQTIAT